MKAFRLALPSVLLLLSCIESPVVVTKPGGDESTVTFANGGFLSAELLAVDSSSVYFLNQETVWRAELTDLRGIRVRGYNLWIQKGVALALFTAVDVPLALATGGWVSGVIGGTFAVAAAEMFLTEPDMRFRPPFGPASRDRLSLYCRYMRCPTSEQWAELLSHYRQKEFHTLGPGLQSSTAR